MTERVRALIEAAEALAYAVDRFAYSQREQAATPAESRLYAALDAYQDARGDTWAECSICRGEGEVRRNPGYPDPQTEISDTCSNCNGTGAIHEVAAVPTEGTPR